MAELISLQPTDAAVNDERYSVSVVIPLYNEQNILNENVETLAGFFDAVVGRDRWYFVFVENGSTDSTPALAAAAAARRPPSRVIHLPTPNYGIALKTGLRAATTRWVYVVDIEQWDFPFIAWSWKNRNAYDALIASKLTLPSKGPQSLMVRCTNTDGEAQPDFPIWNPGGYMYHTIETTHVIAA